MILGFQGLNYRLGLRPTPYSQKHGKNRKRNDKIKKKKQKKKTKKTRFFLGLIFPN